MTCPRSRPRDLGAEKIAQIEFDGFEGDHLPCVRLNNSDLDIGGKWLVLTLLTRGIDARLCQDFLCWWELAIYINSRPSFRESKLPAAQCLFVKSYKYILGCCDCRNANLDRAETTI